MGFWWGSGGVLVGSGGFWWFLVGSGGFWLILVGSGGFWWVLVGSVGVILFQVSSGRVPVWFW